MKAPPPCRLVAKYVCGLVWLQIPLLLHASRSYLVRILCACMSKTFVSTYAVKMSKYLATYVCAQYD